MESLDQVALGVLLFALEGRDEEDRGAVFAFADASAQVQGLLKPDLPCAGRPARNME
jgi:hypothetical protein